MNQPLGSREWAATRGDRWRSNLAGMEAMLAAVDAPLATALDLRGACRIADVGCGGGGGTLGIARRAPAGSVVDGFDITPGLIEAARERLPHEAGVGALTVAFHVADMATAAPPGPPYQRLASRFGVMFFEDEPAAFANLSRWLSAGGTFAFAVWARPADNPWITSARDAVAEVVAVPQPDHDAPGPFRYADPARLLALLAAAGFQDVAVGGWRGQLAPGGGLPAAAAARFALGAFSSFADLLAQAGGDAQDRAQASLTARLQPHERDGVVRMDAHVHIVTGARR
jgi:SAM-dependent methyltransferase